MPEPYPFPCRFSQGVGGCKSPRLFFVGTARGHLQKIGKSRVGSMVTVITTTMTHGQTPATIMRTAGATTSTDCRRIHIDAAGYQMDVV